MALHRYMLRFFVGPVAVGQVAEAMRLARHPVGEGTEHIWVEWEGEDALGAAVGFRASLCEQAGTDFGIELKEQRRVGEWEGRNF